MRECFNVRMWEYNKTLLQIAHCKNLIHCQYSSIESLAHKNNSIKNGFQNR